LRITGGEARGRSITGPEGLELRPTGSKVRQAFFNIVGFELNACRFLDLCAGTGLMGIEALSRGAQSLISVELNRPTAKTIEHNLRHLGYDAEVICGDVLKVIPVLEAGAFDIIFADPPYKSGLHERIIELVENHQLIAEDGTLVIEHLRKTDLPESAGALTRSAQRHYGQTTLSFYKSGS
jgi:16S rRNA (guanine(966)-N(2))-methyltransferase RsmD